MENYDRKEDSRSTHRVEALWPQDGEVRVDRDGNVFVLEKKIVKKSTNNR